MKSKPEHPAVDVAERTIGGVLDELEDKTGEEVVGISLEDMVNTDPATGQPVLEKTVEIQTRHHPAKRWSK